jgi:L-asparagine oxygenase
MNCTSRKLIDHNGSLRVNNDNIILTDEEREAMRRIIDGLPCLVHRSLDEDELFTQVRLASTGIPHRVARLLIDFRKNSNDQGMILIRNLPFDPTLPVTPKDGRVLASKTSHFSEYCLLLTMMYLGEPIAYEDEKDGAIIQNICPIAGHESRQENSGCVLLEFHTEDGFHPYKPDYLGLFCLRSDHDQIAKTVTASIRRALPLVPTRAVSILRQPLYRIRLASSFAKSSDQVLYSDCMPVLSGDLLEPDMCVDFHAMEALHPAAQTALDTLKDALTQVIVGCMLAPGDLIIVDNRVAVHGRTEFKPRHDGTDRWLQRLFVVEDFRRTRASRRRAGHVCTSLTVEFFRNSVEIPVIS